MKKILLIVLAFVAVLGVAASTTTVWSGSWSSGSDWNSWQDISSGSLSGVKSGDKLVFKANSQGLSGVEPRIQVNSNDWQALSYTGSEASVAISNGQYTLDVTSSNCDKIKSGLHVKGQNICLTKVELVSDGQGGGQGGDEPGGDTPDVTGQFHTSGTRLIDAKGYEFVMRGCNYSWAWQRGQEYSVIPAAKRIGCNAIRIQLSTGVSRQWPKATKSDIENLIKLCEQNKLIVVFNTHDETGSEEVSRLETAANFWIEMKDVLNAHLSTVIVNISNEWFGGWNQAGKWAKGYKQVIPMMREAGIKNTLIVDAAGYGQWPDCIWLKGQEVYESDPDRNLMFSMHVYDDLGKDEWTVQNAFEKSLAINVPLLVGEFAYKHKGKDVAYQKTMDLCQEKSVGYLVWSWTGNSSEVADCDMFGSYDDSYYKPNGEKTVNGRNGIKATSKECTVFDSSIPSKIEEIIGEEPEQTTIDWDMPVEIYDLSGRRVGSMHPGSVYIVRQGSVVMKIIGK